MNPELFLTYSTTLTWLFEAKSDLSGNKEKKWDARAWATVVLILSAAYIPWIGWLRALWQLVLLALVHEVFHSGFINLWRGRRWFAHFTVDGPWDTWDKWLNRWYVRGVNPDKWFAGIMVVLTIIYIVIY